MGLAFSFGFPFYSLDCILFFKDTQYILLSLLLGYLRHRVLADLAAADGRSPFHLQRIFSAEVRESLLQYSRRVRL